MRIWSGLLIGLCLTSAQAAGLKEILDQVWERDSQARALEGRREASAARGRIAEGWIAGPPTAGVSLLTDRLTESNGKHEWEVDLGVPLWPPGERRARQALAGREAMELEAEARALRLELAGRLREAVWTVLLAQVEHQLAQRREADARALAQDIARRVQAGELPRTDLLLARDETLAERRTVLEKAAELSELQRAYRELTGTTDLPTEPEETVAEAAPVHPDLIATQLAAAVAEARVRVATRTLDERPQFIVGAKREQAEAGAEIENSLRIGIRIPLGGDRFRRPEIAAAQAELSAAATDHSRASERIPLVVQTARTALELETERLTLAQDKQAIAQEHLVLAHRSFTQGASNLAALLRVRAIAGAADLELAHQQIRVSRARARLNQAQGVLP